MDPVVMTPVPPWPAVQDKIEYAVPGRTLPQETWYSSIQRAVGIFFRNRFFLPLYQAHPNPAYAFNHSAATPLADALMNAQLPCPSDIAEIRNHFSVRDLTVNLKSQPISRILYIRLFESKEQIGGKWIRVFLFCFNANREEEGTRVGPWEPLSADALSHTPLEVLQALASQGIHCDSLVTTSLGNVTMAGLPSSSSESEHLPSTWVINRGFTSVEKVGNVLYPWPLNRLLHIAVRWAGWDADAEGSMLTFLKQAPKKPSVWMIEARNDNYFSGAGRFAIDFHTQLHNAGVSVSRTVIYPYPFQWNAQHALPLNLLGYNNEGSTLIDDLHLNVQNWESMADVMVRNIFLGTEANMHACFWVSGNDATPAVGTVRDVAPVLLALIQAGKKHD